MKVKITVTLDVNAKAWADEFFVTPEDVREDVQNYFAEGCNEQLYALGLHAKQAA